MTCSDDANSVIEILGQLDQEGDGTIQRPTFCEVLRCLGIHISHEELEALIAAAAAAAAAADRSEEAVNQDSKVCVDMSGRVRYTQLIKWLFSSSPREEAHHAVSCCKGPGAHRLSHFWSLDWSQFVPVPKMYHRRTVCISDAAQRAITLAQLNELADLVKLVLAKIHKYGEHPKANDENPCWDTVTMYHINELFVLPLTQRENCSFTELVAKGPQDPCWFISHWWGTPFRDTLEMMKYHSDSRVLSSSSAYWICTFANNQHQYRDAKHPDLEQMPFMKALMSCACQGTLMLMDKHATPFRRSWCIFETWLTIHEGLLKDPQMLIDIAAIVDGGCQGAGSEQGCAQEPLTGRFPALLKDNGCGSLVELTGHVTGRRFPPEVARYGIAIDLSSSEASNQSDKCSILDWLLQRSEVKTKPESKAAASSCLDEVNLTIKKFFGLQALVDAVLDDDVETAQALLQDDLARVNDKDARGFTPLHICCMRSHQSETGTSEVMNLLLNNRADLEHKAKSGSTALMAAITSNSMQPLETLLNARADPDLVSQKYAFRDNECEGYTSLHAATMLGASYHVELLLDSRADPNLATGTGVFQASGVRFEFHGCTALLMAAYGLLDQATHIAGLLLNAHADPNWPLEAGTVEVEKCVLHLTGCTPLHLAAWQDRTDMVKVLLDSRADPHCADGSGRTPRVFAAASQGRSDSGDVLILLREAEEVWEFEHPRNHAEQTAFGIATMVNTAKPGGEVWDSARGLFKNVALTTIEEFAQYAPRSPKPEVDVLNACEGDSINAAGGRRLGNEDRVAAMEALVSYVAAMGISFAPHLPAALQAICAQAKHANPKVRAAAAKALGCMGRSLGDWSEGLAETHPHREMAASMAKATVQAVIGIIEAKSSTGGYEALCQGLQTRGSLMQNAEFVKLAGPELVAVLVAAGH